MSGDIIKACIDVELSEAEQVKAAQLAIEENPANAAVFSFAPGFGVQPPPPPFLALITGKKWRPGRTLRVRFLDGDPAVQARIEPFAQAWTKYANIKLVFSDDPEAEIRISFKHAGSWSVLGTDALSRPPFLPTMNFGWLKPETDDDEYSRVVTHEFGHALGCIHEHQNPTSGIPWDKEAVYAYYTGPPNNWSKTKVDFNLFRRYSKDITQFTEFDPHSIMLYPVDNRFTLGDFEIPWRNKTLSEEDKRFIAAVYPHGAQTPVELTIDGAAVAANIGDHGEEDLFTFTVTEPGAYRVETMGFTDVTLALFGPDSQTDLIAEDNDSGFWFNARVRTELGPGQYFVRVRHNRPSGRGKYRIVVRRQF